MKKRYMYNFPKSHFSRWGLMSFCFRLLWDVHQLRRICLFILNMLYQFHRYLTSKWWHLSDVTSKWWHLLDLTSKWLYLLDLKSKLGHLLDLTSKLGHLIHCPYTLFGPIKIVWKKIINKKAICVGFKRAAEDRGSLCW